MILAFSGDRFLARRAARDALREHGVDASALTELGEGLDAERLRQHVGQSGLFGRAALLLDFDEAFVGQGGVKPRNETLQALAGADEQALIAIVDSGASASRQKRYRELGRLQHLPTPRFARLPRWIAEELERAGVRHRPGVPALLADLFGEDLPAISAEVRKLAVLDEELDEARVRFLVHRPASRDAFDLIEAAVAGRAGDALRVARALLQAGEPPPRVLAVLRWQFQAVARAVGLLEREGRVSREVAARALGLKPFVAGKVLAIAGALDERAVAAALWALLEAELATKTGRDAALALDVVTLRLAGAFAAEPAA